MHFKLYRNNDFITKLITTNVLFVAERVSDKLGYHKNIVLGLGVYAHMFLDRLWHHRHSVIAFSYEFLDKIINPAKISNPKFVFVVSTAYDAHYKALKNLNTIKQFFIYCIVKGRSDLFLETDKKICAEHGTLHESELLW